MKRFFRHFAFLSLSFVALLPELSAQQNIWVYFRDKGPDAPKLLRTASPEDIGLSPAAMERRAMTGSAAANQFARQLQPSASLIDAQDLPVYRPYIDRILLTGATHRATSKWFNAVSVSCTPEQARQIAALSDVQSIEPVRSWKKNRDVPFQPGAFFRTFVSKSQYGLDYGDSKQQLELINVPKVHDVWIDGTGIIVGMLDVGFRWRYHDALKNLHVLGEYDFINKDSVTENQDISNDDYSQDLHGTITFSTIAGFCSGRLIGPAFNASYYLAKTEVSRTELPIEEDYWIAGMEWQEAKGSQVVSISLAYGLYDDSTGYSYANGDFNGRTAKVSIAAARAAHLGVVVVNAMGNEGNRPGTLLAPADADSIISVGAIDFANSVAGFSSNGPTNDGRIKPDVTAPGSGVFCATKPDSNSYTRANGTSLATPLAAGVAALVRSARPELTPLEVRDALRNTADKASAPDNSHGWGKVNAWTALLNHGMVISTNPKILWDGEHAIIAAYVLSPKAVYNDAVRVSYLTGSDPVRKDLTMEFSSQYDQLGTGAGLYMCTMPAIPKGTPVRFFITASDIAETRTSPFGAPVRYHQVIAGETRAIGAEYLLSKDLKLDQSYPTPYLQGGDRIASISFTIPIPGADIHLDVFDMLGRKIMSIYEGYASAGIHTVRFFADGLSNGVYFYRLVSGGQQLTRQMIVHH